MHLCFKHGAWLAQPIQPVVRLRQGCSLPLRVFRCMMPDVMVALRRNWQERGYGFGIAECHLL